MNNHHHIFGSFSSLRFYDIFSHLFWKYSSTFLTVSRSYCSQRNLYTIFLPVILSSVKSNFVKNYPMSLCVPTSKIIATVKVLSKILFLSYRTKISQSYFPKKPSITKILVFVKLIYPILITNRILCR